MEDGDGGGGGDVVEAAVHVSAQSALVGMDHEAASQVLAACLCLRTTMPTTGTNTPHILRQNVPDVFVTNFYKSFKISEIKPGDVTV